MNNHGLDINKDVFYLAGQPTFLLTGEFPYYRLSSEEWPDRLDTIKDAGVKVITTYIPWNFHELADGDFDFTGRTDERRNLEHFLRLLKERGLFLIAKPGPFICAEVQHGGIPNWLTAVHQEIIARAWDGSQVGFRQDGFPLPDYQHPTYITYVSRWYRALANEVLQDAQYPGGSLIALQVENEIPYSTSELADPFSWGYTEIVQQAYCNWLAEKYNDINYYNNLHNTSWSAFTDIIAPSRWWDVPNVQAWLTYQDWVEFKANYAAETLRRYCVILREAGITVPLYHNFLMLEDESPTMYRQIAMVLDFVGANFWLDDDPRTSYDAYVRTDRRLLQITAAQPDRPMYIPELNWGWGSVELFDFLTRYTLSRVDGTNVYTLVNSDNAGELGDRHYSNNPEPYPGNAPIGVRGEKTAGYYAVRNITLFLEGVGQRLTQAKPVAEVAIGIYPSYNHPTTYIRWGKQSTDQVTQVFGYIPDMNGWLQAIMKLLINQDVDFTAVDVEAASLENLLLYRVLIVPGYCYMDRMAQEKLLNYVRTGGHLVMMPTIPFLGSDMQPVTLLRDGLFRAPESGFYKPATPLPFTLMLDKYKENVWGSQQVNLYDVTGPGLEPLGYTNDGQVWAYQTRLGKGSGILLGTLFQIPSANSSSLHWLIENLGIQARFAYSNVSDVEVKLRAGKEHSYLFIMNRGSHPFQGPVYWLDKGKWRRLEVSAGAGAVTILELQGSRVTSAALTGDDTVFLRFDGGEIHTRGGGKLVWVCDNAGGFRVTADSSMDVTLDIPGAEGFIIYLGNDGGLPIASTKKEGGIVFKISISDLLEYPYYYLLPEH